MSGVVSSIGNAVSSVASGIGSAVSSVAKVAAPVVATAFGGPVAGAVTGGLIGGLSSGSLSGALRGAAGGALGNYLGGAMGLGSTAQGALTGSLIGGLSSGSLGGALAGGALGGLAGYLPGLGSQATGTVGDMAAMIQQVNPGMSAGDAMNAAQSLINSGVSPAQYAGMLTSSGALSANQILQATGNNALASAVSGGLGNMLGNVPSAVSNFLSSPAYTGAGATGAGGINLGSLLGTGLSLAGTSAALGNLPSSSQIGQQYLTSMTNPLAQSLAQGRSDLTQSLGLRGLGGSSIGASTLQNYDVNAAQQMQDATARALGYSYGQQMQAGQLRNSLIGSGLYSLGQNVGGLFSPTQVPLVA